MKAERKEMQWRMKKVRTLAENLNPSIRQASESATPMAVDGTLYASLVSMASVTYTRSPFNFRGIAHLQGTT